MASTRKGYLAVKKEATLQVAEQPTHFLRFKDGDIIRNKEVIENNPIQGIRWNALNAVPGKEETNGAYNFDLDYRECVYWLYMGLGNIASADISSLTDGSVYQHTLTVADVLPGLTVEQGKGNLGDTSNNRQNYQVDRSFGVMIDSFVLSASEGIVNLAVNVKAHGQFQESDLVADATAGSTVDLYLKSVEGLTTSDTVNIYDETPQSETDAIAAIDTAAKTIEIATLDNSYTVANKAKVELLPQTPSYSDDALVASFCHVSFQFGDDLTAAASAAETNIENWELEFTNGLEERYGSLRCSPSVIAEKGNKAMLKFTKYFENVEERDRYVRLEKQAGILTITNDEIVSATDTNNAKYTVQIEMSDIRFTTYELPTGTDEVYAATTEATLFYDRTDARAIRALVTNDKIGTTYTA